MPFRFEQIAIPTIDISSGKVYDSYGNEIERKEEKLTDYGIPEPDLQSQLLDLQKKGYGAEDAKRAIDLHIEIKDKESAKKLVDKVYNS